MSNMNISGMFGAEGCRTFSTQRYATQLCLCNHNRYYFAEYFCYVTSLNVAHWSKSVMHATHLVIFTINNDLFLAVQKWHENGMNMGINHHRQSAMKKEFKN